MVVPTGKEAWFTFIPTRRSAVEVMRVIVFDPMAESPLAVTSLHLIFGISLNILDSSVQAKVPELDRVVDLIDQTVDEDLV